MRIELTQMDYNGRSGSRLIGAQLFYVRSTAACAPFYDQRDPV
jgi:hypothetical protein